MDNSFIILASIIGLVTGSVITIVSIALSRGNGLKDSEPITEPTINPTPIEIPVKRKPGRPKKVKQS
jgi:hypothetical protein